MGNGLEIVRRVPANTWALNRKWNNNEAEISPEQIALIAELMAFFSYKYRIRDGIVWWLKKNPEASGEELLQVLDALYERELLAGTRRQSEAQAKGQCSYIVKHIVLFSFLFNILNGGYLPVTRLAF